MKKYNLSKIMKKAWEEAKKSTGKAAEITLSTVKSAAQHLVTCGQYETISYREWSNYGKSRIYIKAIRHTLAGNVRIADCGYWDLDNNKYVPQAVDLLA